MRYRRLYRRRRVRPWLWVTLTVALVVMGLVLSLFDYDFPDPTGLIKGSEPKPVGGRVVSFRPVANLSENQVDANAKAVQLTAHTAKNPVSEYSLVYTSQEPRSEGRIEVGAKLYLPRDSGAAPGIAFGPGTTGPGPLCAPSLERSRGKNWGRYDNHFEYLAGQGYAVIAIDYDGRKPGQIHHYFVGESEGRLMLDALRALQNFKDPAKPVKVSKTAFLAGFSQGGHAALWADRVKGTYAPELTIDGVATFAAATDLTKIMADTVNGYTASIWLPPYLYAAYDDYYGLTMAATEMLQEPFASAVATDARTLCIDQVEIKTGRYGPVTNLPQVYQTNFINTVRAGMFTQGYPELADLFAENLAGQPTATPVLLQTGEKDAVILPNSQTELAQRLCRGGTGRVKLVKHAAATHYNILSVGSDQMLDWFRQISFGQKGSSDCQNYR